MKSIELSKETYERLKARSRSWEETPEVVVAHLLDITEQNTDVNTPFVPERDDLYSSRRTDRVREFSARPLPNLSFTEIIHARIDGAESEELSWLGVIKKVIIRASRDIQSNRIDNLKRVSSFNLVQGYKSVSGYSYIPELDISVQAMVATTACDRMLSIAKRIGFPIELRVKWRNHEKAMYPGEIGLICAESSAVPKTERFDILSRNLLEINLKYSKLIQFTIANRRMYEVKSWMDCFISLIVHCYENKSFQGSLSDWMKYIGFSDSEYSLSSSGINRSRFISDLDVYIRFESTNRLIQKIKKIAEICEVKFEIVCEVHEGSDDQFAGKTVKLVA